MKTQGEWKKRSLLGSFFAILIPLVFIVGLTGCVTKPVPISRDYSALLFKEGGVFLQLKPQQDPQLTAEILELTESDPESMKEILDRTREVFIQYSWEKDAPRYTMICEGSYPETLTGFALRRNGEWEKVKGQGQGTYSWWQQVDAPLKLSFIDDDLVCICNGDMEAVLRRIYGGPQEKIPDPVRSRLNSSTMGLYAYRPNIPVQGMRLFEEMESFWFSFDSASSENATTEHVFFINGEYFCNSEIVANSLYLMMRINLLGMVGKNGGLLQALSDPEKDPVIKEGRTVRLRNYPLSLDQLHRFFGKVLPYMNRIINGQVMDGGL